MPEIEFEFTLQLARQLVGRLPGDMDDHLRELIARAEQEHDPSIGMDITSLLTQNDNIRRWLNEQSQLQNPHERIEVVSKGGYGPLAGGKGSVPASRKWICEANGCVESLPVIQEDEDAPRCRVHGCVMVRQKKGKG
jgi:hypothetical protein